MATTTTALLVPANYWKPVRLVELSRNWVQDAYDHLGCRIVEVIYPANHDTTVELAPGLVAHVIGIGDEEGRLVERPEPNPRVTALFEYPYDIVGDILLVGTDEAGGPFLDFKEQWLNILKGAL